jgi:hypothetical protein
MATKKTTRKRARNSKGQYVGDNPNTPFRNEAYEKKYHIGDFAIAFIIVLGLVLLYLYR